MSFRVAIVGSGPAGFYTAHHLFKSGVPVAVDFYERLAAPYGLSRYGVAPDHPEVKNCEEYLDNIMKDQSSARFFGNVAVGSDISLETLQRQYHAVVLSYGCTSGDNQLGITGDGLNGVVPARKLVNWYNSHPDSVGWTPPDFASTKNVTIIGNGNVALDVARVLVGSPSKHWAPTDISPKAIKSLEQSSVESLSIVARRGFLQSAFTNKELRELLELSTSQGWGFDIDESILNSVQTGKLGRVDKRRLQIIEKYLGKNPTATNRWSLDYHLAPKAVLGTEKVTGIEYYVTELDEQNKVKKTDKTVTRDADLIITSIGYQGSMIGNNVGIQFASNHIANSRGRVLDPNSQAIPGLYCSGWIKNGPQGVIATTMMDSFDTAEIVLEDLRSGNVRQPDQAVAPIPNAIRWDQWQHLNDVELKEGAKLDKTRLKVDNTPEMLAIER